MPGFFLLLFLLMTTLIPEGIVFAATTRECEDAPMKRIIRFLEKEQDRILLDQKQLLRGVRSMGGAEFFFESKIPSLVAYSTHDLNQRRDFVLKRVQRFAYRSGPTSGSRKMRWLQDSPELLLGRLQLYADQRYELAIWHEEFVSACGDLSARTKLVQAKGEVGEKS